MAMTCTVCRHESRALIDRLIGSGTVTEQTIADQFRLGRTAVHRHKDHVLATVKRTIERRTTERNEDIASKWVERLDAAYRSAQRGVERAEQPGETQWPAGARYLAVLAKLIDSGLQVDGVIGPAAVGNTTTTVEQVLILPQSEQLTPVIPATCEEDEPKLLE